VKGENGLISKPDLKRKTVNKDSLGILRGLASSRKIQEGQDREGDSVLSHMLVSVLTDPVFSIWDLRSQSLWRLSQLPCATVKLEQDFSPFPFLFLPASLVLDRMANAGEEIGAGCVVREVKETSTMREKIQS
jgi:hypothetical protein